MFALALWLCSAGVIQKYAGTLAAVAYAPLCIGAARAATVLGARAARIPRATAVVALAVIALVVVAAVVVFYPHANPQGTNVGSDRDDAATIGARRLAHGDYPYAERTYLGNPISQFPAGLVAAIPFVEATGSAGYESVVWFPLLLLLVAWIARSAGAAVAVVAVALGTSPGLWRELLTGGDLIPCVTAVCACLAFLEQPWAWPLLGAALAWRPNLAVSAVPFLFRLGPVRAAAAAGVAASVFLLVTLPFALHGGFTPWSVSNKLESYNGVVPGGGWTLLVAGLALTALLAWRGVGNAWSQAAVPQALYIGAFALKACVEAHRLDLTPLVSGYGVLALVPAMLGVAARARVTNINAP